MKVLWLAVLVLALGAGLLVFLLGTSGSRGARGEAPPPPAGRTEAPPQPSTPPPEEEPTTSLSSEARRQAVDAGAAPGPRSILEGAVIGEGAPIPGASLQLLRNENLLASTATDARGRFRLEIEPLTAAATLRVLARGFVATERALPPRPAAGTILLGNLRVLRGQRLAGQVVDELANGIPDAEIRVEPFQPSSDQLVARGRSGPDGRFEIPDAPPGTVRVQARARGFGEQGVEYAPSPEPLVIRLAPGAELRLRLLTPRGAPVAGAQVSIQQPSDTRAVKREAESDAEGRVLFDGLSAPLWNVRVTHPEYRTKGPNQVQVTGAEVTIECLPWPAIEGLVRIPDGRAIPAGTRAQALPASAPSDRVTAFEGGQAVASDGKFRIGGLRGGDWRVRVTAPGFAPAISQPVKLGIEGDGHAGTIDLVAGGTLTVRLRRGSEPVAGAALEVFTSEPSPAQLWAYASARGPNSARQASSDADGAAVLPNLSAGPLWVAIYAEGSPPAKSGPHLVGDGPSPAPIEIELARGARITGRVAGKGGVPARAQLRILARGGTPGIPLTFASEADGRYTSAWLPGGAYTIEAFSTTDSAVRSGPKELELAPGELRNLDLQL